MADLVFITGNQHKADQYSRLLARSLSHQKVDLEEIQSKNIEEIARHKIEQAYSIVSRPVIIDDFGFCMDGLDGLPGPFTKYFADTEMGLERLCRIADVLPSRRARVVCVIAYKDASTLRIFKRELTGHVAEHPRGSLGIDTDLIFEPDGYGGRTRAELTQQEYDKVQLAVRPIEDLVKFLDDMYA